MKSRERIGIEIAAKMYDAQDAMKLLLGDKYADAIAPYVGFLREASTDRGVPVLDVIANVLRDTAIGPNTKAMMLSAAVELFEGGDIENEQ